MPNFVNVPVATGSNRANSSGIPIAPINRSSTVITNTVDAGKTVVFTAPGNVFYVTVATASVNIRPKGGVFNSYAAGTGLQLSGNDFFTQIEVNNPNAQSVVFQIFVGFDNFIDNRLILNNASNPNVVFPTYKTPSTSATVNINDLSGGPAFKDINGNSWFAISRVAIVVSNIDTGTTYLLQAKGTNTSNGPAICAIFPQTSIRLDVSGDYALATGGGNINAIVSEIYQAVAAT